MRAPLCINLSALRFLAVDLPVLNAYLNIRLFGNLRIVRNHHDSLTELLAGHFQKADHLVTGEAVQISCGLICQNNGRFRN